MTSKVLVRLIALTLPTFAARSRAGRYRPRSPKGTESGRSSGLRVRLGRPTTVPVQLRPARSRPFQPTSVIAPPAVDSPVAGGGIVSGISCIVQARPSAPTPFVGAQKHLYWAVMSNHSRIVI